MLCFKPRDKSRGEWEVGLFFWVKKVGLWFQSNQKAPKGIYLDGEGVQINVI